LRYCHNCGESIDEKAIICVHCGVQQPSVKGSSGIDLSGERNRLVAALLAFFLGGIGAHKFYLGDMNTGILYLIFFWTFIPAVLGIIDGVIYLSMSDAEFALKYN